MNINNPKVFISYAWTNKEYSDKVLLFTHKLIDCGIEVIFDRFENTPGKDLLSFMEKSVNDKSVTNVLILLNPTYKQKADKREGGVGYEGTIISTEIYNKTEQTKYIPVILDKDNKEIKESIPTFLGSRLYVDLSEDDETEFKKLVKLLFGRPDEIKPKLGKMPIWVDRPLNSVSKNPMVQKVSKSIERIIPNDYKSVIFEELQNVILGIISIEFNQINSTNIVEELEKTINYRDVYIEIINKISNIVDLEKIIWNFYHRLNVEKSKDSNLRCIIDYFCMETFIYTIAILFKKKNFAAIGYLTSVEWILNDLYKDIFKFNDFFYHYDLDELFILYYSNRDKKRYLSGTAHYWMEHINVHISKEEFASADILLSNLAIINNNKRWFAKSYVYGNEYRNYLIYEIEIALQSNKLYNDYLPLFDCKTLIEFEDKYKNLVEFSKGTNHFGYTQAFHAIPLIKYKNN